ncbi:MAG: tetratricopeptide repeat protein [Bacteroidota bacterium]
MMKNMKRYLLTLLVLSFTQFGIAQTSNDIQLANEYYGQGEFEKAKKLYDDLAKDMRNISLIHNNYFFLLRELKAYKEAEKYINRLIKRYPDNIYYRLDLGLLYLSEGKETQSDKYFKDIVKQIRNDNYLTRISAQYFINQQLTDYAVYTFKEGRRYLSNPFAFSLEMANVYRIMNEKDLMVEEYLNYVIQNPSNLNYVKNTLQNLLAKPEELESLETLLYTKIQEEPDNDVYGELLIWVNLQQKNFYGAFIQARAIDKRLRTEGEKCINIGLIALDNGDYDNAIKIFTYVIREYPGSINYTLAKMYLIRSYENRVKNIYPVDEREIRNLISDYNIFINELGVNRNTLQALRNKALLHAFYLDEKDTAIYILNKIINTPRADAELKAKSKLDLGDIYILTGEPWESTLLYSQVEKSMKETPTGYLAKLKNAKLSYYKGEFALAQEHLDILKEATTREIANDAMSLSILIKDNTALDSTDQAMQQYASIELMLFQNKTEQALEAIRKMKNQYDGHSLTDELLWLESDIYLKKGQFETAIDLLKIIVENYDYDILSDDAYFTIADIYQRQLNDTEKSMAIYRDFLTKYPGSVYVTEARKRFRQLRGDFKALEEGAIN